MRTIILSCHDSDKLKNYPVVAWAWNQLGWNTHLFYLGRDSVLIDEFKKIRQYFDTTRNVIHRLPQMEGYENDIILQASKLFGGFCYWDDRILMTADIDIIPLKDSWPHFREGRMVTADKAISRYLGMQSGLWRMKMETNDNTNLDQELKLFLDSDTELRDDNPVNRTICLNKIIIDRFIPKGMQLEDVKEPNHIKADKFNNLEIQDILFTHYNTLPGWM